MTREFEFGGEKDEAWRSDLVEKRNLQAKFEVMGCICQESVGTMAPVEGNINAAKYHDILEEHLWPVLARHFP